MAITQGVGAVTAVRMIHGKHSNLIFGHLEEGALHAQ